MDDTKQTTGPNTQQTIADEQFLAILLSSQPNPAFIINPADKTIFKANEKAYKLLAYTDPELNNLDFKLLFKDKVSDFDPLTVGSDIPQNQRKRWICKKKNNRDIFVELTLTRFVLAQKEYDLLLMWDVGRQLSLENELRERNRQMITLFMHFPGIIYRCSNDREWTMHIIEGLCKELTGYDADDLIGNNKVSYNDLICTEYREYLWNKWQELLPQHGIFNAEYKIITADGKIKWVWEQGTGIYDDDDNVIALEGIILDITERKEAKQQLNEKTLELENYFTNALDLFCVTDKKVRIIRLNSQWEHVLGYKVSEIQDKAFLGFVHPSDKEETMAYFTRVRLSEEVQSLVNRMKCSNGSHKWIEWRSVSSAGRVYSAARDITGRVNIEEALREQQDRLRSLINAMPDIVCFKDAEGRWLEANEFAINLFKLHDLEYHHKTDLQLAEFIPELKEAFTECYNTDQATWKSGRPWRGDEYKKQKDGRVKIFDVIKIPRYNPDGSKNSLLVVGRDVTERKLAEDALKKLNAVLEQKISERTALLEATNKELEAFAYSVSHDLRAPLRAIDGFSRIITNDYSTVVDEEGKRLLTVIRNNVSKMDKLITDLLSLSRISQNEMKYDDVDMMMLAKAAINEYLNDERKANTTIIEKDMPLAYGDSSILRYVWNNLISNAIKFTSGIQNAEIEIGGYIENHLTVYYIKDNGVGFNPEYAHKLFTVFQRLHDAATYEGTGIGLALVQRIVHRHRGKVWASGIENQGAEFYFAIPLK